MALVILQKHRESFVQESDFRFLASKGINAVRIPVGYWIASDPNPPAPYVSGSLQALDNGFQWAKYEQAAFGFILQDVGVSSPCI